MWREYTIYLPTLFAAQGAISGTFAIRVPQGKLQRRSVTIELAISSLMFPLRNVERAINSQGLRRPDRCFRRRERLNGIGGIPSRNPTLAAVQVGESRSLAGIPNYRDWKAFAVCCPQVKQPERCRRRTAKDLQVAYPQLKCTFFSQVERDMSEAIPPNGCQHTDTSPSFWMIFATGTAGR